MKFLLYFTTLILVNFAHSQKKVELSNSNYLQLQEKVRFLMSTDVDSAFVVEKQIENSSNVMHKAFAFGAKSYLYQLKNDSVNSKKSYTQATYYFNLLKPSLEKTKLNSYLLNYSGLCDYKRNNYSDALIKYQKGRLLSLQVNDVKQLIKFSNNIALINKEIGNYKESITALKQSIKTTNENAILYDEKQLKFNNFNGNYRIANSYYGLYINNKQPISKYIDSSSFFYKKALVFADNSSEEKLKVQMCLGNVCYLNGNYKDAESMYQNVYLKGKKDEVNLSYISCSLSCLYYKTKEYDKVLFYTNKVDSVYKTNKEVITQYVISNYLQSKIYTIKNNESKAHEKAKIYLDNFEKVNEKQNNEADKINLTISLEDQKKEMLVALNKNRKNDLVQKWIKYSLILLFILFLFIFVKQIIARKTIEKKFNLFMNEYKNNENQRVKDIGESVNNTIDINVVDKKGKISIDEDKENEIIEKLKKLELKLDYLKPDFTQQLVAKKIKTNTTYLSYIVNKRFGISFSEYTNELKLNYIINEMITNTTFRKYSTQAIAESAGFKNAVSFSKSFKKKTGITPVEFTKKLL